MDPITCSIHALLACFSWSGFYIDGGLQYQDIDVPRAEMRTTAREGRGAIETVTALYKWDDDQNPYGRIALGYELNFPSITWRVEASHLSSIDTGTDRGVNAIGISARWYPFRR
jgi:hypothetical protein